MKKRIIRLTVPVLIVTLLAASVPSRAGALEQASASDYVEVLAGDMPLMFAVGHGGWKTVGTLKNASEDFSTDPLLPNYLYQILLPRIYERTGHLPYLVYNQGKRNYVNPNRPVGHSEAYHADNAEAQAVYMEFHNQIDAMIARIENRHGADMAVMINPHTGHLEASLGDRPWARIAEIGFIASVTNLGSNSNTMRALYSRKGEVALRGEDSIPYQLFHGQDWPDPNAVWPAAATSNSKTLAKTGADVWHVLPAWVTGWNTDNWVTAYLNGYSTIQYHGTNTSSRHSNWANGLDAFQMEVNYLRESGISLRETDPEYDPGGSYYQLDVSFTTALMDDLIDAILHCLEVNYNWTPGGVYNVIVDNGDASFSTTGAWQASTGMGFWGTPSVRASQTGATATWAPELASSGTYEVLVRWTGGTDRTHNAQYTIHYAGGSPTFAVDQGGGQDAKWVSLGQFPFNAGGDDRVVLSATAGATGTLAADAVLFRLVSGGNQPPIAALTAAPTLGEAPLAVSFNAAGSTDPDGTIDSYEWNLGDGAHGSGITITHTYTRSGAFVVTLSVADDDGATDSETMVIGVRLPPASGDVIVDNLDPGFTSTGQWSESEASREYAGSSLQAASAGATATWTPTLPESGTYMVLAWWGGNPIGATQAPYTIVHAAGQHTVRVNQRENAGRWMPLGIYEFVAGSATWGSVTLTRENGDGDSTNADAIRFVRVAATIYLPVMLSGD